MAYTGLCPEVNSWECTASAMRADNMPSVYELPELWICEASTLKPLEKISTTREERTYLLVQGLTVSACQCREDSKVRSLVRELHPRHGQLSLVPQARN